MNSIVDEIKEKQAVRKKRKGVRIFVTLLIILLLAAGAFGAYIYSDVSGVNIDEPVTVNIEKGSGAYAAAQSLADAGAIKYPLIFRLQSRTAKIKPGPVTVTPDMPYSEIIEILETANRSVQKVVIPEGYEVRQIIDAFVAAGVDREEMTAAVNSRDYDYEFIKEIPERENPLEGYLFPNTYQISADDSAHDIVDMMLAEFDKRYDKAFRAQAQGHGMTMDEIVTLASIIERETNNSDERGKVSGVFYNRLEKNMRLQSCATVQYILKERKTNLTNEDTSIQSPYNTYINAGLPAGPIASPGEDCLLAALYPETTTALYFVLGENGEHIFSDTYEQHLAAKKEAGL